jgi:hypothetical protein
MRKYGEPAYDTDDCCRRPRRVTGEQAPREELETKASSSKLASILGTTGASLVSNGFSDGGATPALS